MSFFGPYKNVIRGSVKDTSLLYYCLSVYVCLAIFSTFLNLVMQVYTFIYFICFTTFELNYLLP